MDIKIWCDLHGKQYVMYHRTRNAHYCEPCFKDTNLDWTDKTGFTDETLVVHGPHL